VASRQSEAVSELYRTWVTEPTHRPDWTPENQRDLVEVSWGTLTSEPRGVDYIEVDAGGVPGMWLNPKGAPADRVLFAIHGGGFISGSIYTHRKLFAHLAKAVPARALMMNYRLIQDGGVYPNPIDEVLSAYRWLLDQGIKPAHIAFAGDSAGGYLSVATQLKARDQGLPLPAATMLLSPWLDIEGTGASLVANKGKDALFQKEGIDQLASNFLSGASPQDPLANPIRGDLTGFGPIYLQVGDQELLLDDSRQLAERAEKAGVEVRLDIFPDQQHTFQMMAGRAPEADDAIRRFADWVQPKLGLPAATT
jgi:monoterpene epsilon-lactone hydrolase